MLGDLHNPSIKPRHWSLIEEVIQHKFDSDEPLTLTLMQDLQIFDYAEAIQEISGQASSEASLESILKKVQYCTVGAKIKFPLRIRTTRVLRNYHFRFLVN